ncbi:hypothetical protein Dimus_033764 [Dionaea muscipula]
MAKRLVRFGVIVFAAVAVCLVFAAEARKSSVDPYKVLGVQRNASQRDIQKAFHKLSLKYHPDKNKSKGAQAKFEEINNAYEILSDEERRKNYDLYGDENPGPSFDTGNTGNHGGYHHFTSGGADENGFKFRPDDWQNMGGQGKSQSFSFSFGGPSGGNSFGFGLNDLFSNFFGRDMSKGPKFEGSSGSRDSDYGGFHSSTDFPKSTAKNIQVVDSSVFEREINNEGVTWLLVSYGPSMPLDRQQELILEEVASSLKGALKVGKVNCESNKSFCKNHGIYPRQAPRAFIYSFRDVDSGYFVEFDGEVNAKRLKSFCQDNLPRVSKHINLDTFDVSFGAGGRLPHVMLLSTRKEAPTIWRALSGLYRKRFVFYHTQVLDVSNPAVKRLGVDAVPALVGWLSNGEKHVIKTGITVKGLESAVQELSVLLNGFEKKNKKVSSSQAKKQEAESSRKDIPLLTASNFNSICGETTPVCIIGAYRSSKARKNLESILLMVSQKTMSRRQSLSSESKDPASHAMLDAVKQQAFLDAFGDDSGFSSADELLLAYKPRKGKYAAVEGSSVTLEEAEIFVGSVLSGDIQFKKVRRKPKLN